MVHLFSDSHKQRYKDFVAGYTTFAQVYDSRTKEWTVVGSGQQSWDLIHGCEYRWHRMDDSFYAWDRRGPCVYDFAERRLQDFGGNSIARGPHGGLNSYSLFKNRLFALHEAQTALEGPAKLVPDSGLPPNYNISEYRLQKDALAWVKVESATVVLLMIMQRTMIAW